MIPRRFRISQKNMQPLLRGVSKHSSLFRVVVNPSFDSNPHIAVIIPKKIVSGAVARNAVRRKIYRAMRAYLPTLPPARTYVFFPNKSCITASFETITESIQECI